MSSQHGVMVMCFLFIHVTMHCQTVSTALNTEDWGWLSHFIPPCGLVLKLRCVDLGFFRRYYRGFLFLQTRIFLLEMISLMLLECISLHAGCFSGLDLAYSSLDKIQVNLELFFYPLSHFLSCTIYLVDDLPDRNHCCSEERSHSAITISKYRTVFDIRHNLSLALQRFYL